MTVNPAKMTANSMVGVLASDVTTSVISKVTGRAINPGVIAVTRLVALVALPFVAKNAGLCEEKSYHPQMGMTWLEDYMKGAAVTAVTAVIVRVAIAVIEYAAEKTLNR